MAGGTLCVAGGGRPDLPGSDPAQMVESLRRLAEIPDETVLFPGHRYSPADSAPMEQVKRRNWVFEQI